MLERTGIPSWEELDKILPPPEVLEKRPVPVIECLERIPCDPCHTSCPTGAIQKFKNINDLPEIDYEKCSGCGICVASCPGLAVFIIDLNYTEEKALVSLPWEMLPFFQVGDTTEALDRSGSVIGEARIEEVRKSYKQDRTLIVSVLVNKDQAMEVRNIRGRGHS